MLIRSTISIPVEVLITNGTKVPIKTKRIFGNSPMPNHMIIMGIHAIGGIGRITSKMLPKNARAFLFHPIKIPKEMPKAHATINARSTRFKLAHPCPIKVVFARGLVNVLIKRLHTVAGDGIISGFELENTIHPRAIIAIARMGNPQYRILRMAFCFSFVHSIVTSS